ncbi:protocadherin Fat 1 [Sinocyclocheilus grahami]|uniref:protocadherin Fat 1 n=1 Tax=Sinocyclocheilus grahami TaxID=75366 RepID=UPI0007ACACE8|nr:PREDICTED: protocadherin Fat 1-like [Sinocyclocheilus grahami]
MNSPYNYDITEADPDRLSSEERSGAQQMEDALSFQFTHPLYNVMIYENSAAKTFVECPIKMGIFMTNQSWDIWYVIESGDHDNLFKAEKYVLGHFCFLRIRTKGGNSATLNREVKDHYLLTVNAIERHTGAETQTQVKVQVLDTNDLRPLFSPTTYSFFVPENSAIRTSVGRVFATDADTSTNGEYYFSFKEWTDMFSIHPTSGVITLTGKLDYSEVALYEIDVLAVDRGLKLYGSSSSTAKLKVHVLQANEHAPVITAVPLTPWNATRDPTYAYVTVEDADEGHNGEIASLSIVAGDPLQQFKAFRTNPRSKEYKIKAIKEVEWKGYSFGYNLTLQAKDKGNPPKFSSAIIVRVKSPSEYTETPTFEKSVYRVTLSEFAPPHSPVVMVKTVQKHSKINYLLQFKMQQHENPFVINPNTGLITTMAPVKAESVCQYEFDVVTSDRRAVAKVVVSISDVNNNAPVFQKSNYEASIAEHVPIGTSVLTVSATDKDDGENGYVTYSIVNINKQPFVVDYFTGVISTAEDLDYETMLRKFSLRIRASDWGSPFRREAETVVSIILTNLNDNKPHFENIDCDVTVPRSLGVGEQIIVVSAIDADDLGVVQYRIDSGNNMNLFELDSSSGVLTLKKSLRDGDAAKQSFHRLKITASDGEISSNPMFLNLTVVSAFKHVRSKCAETGALRTLAGLLLFGSKRHSQKEAEDELADIHSVNRHTPRFIESTPTVIEVKEDLPVGTSVALLRAADSDSGFNGKLLFVISGGDFDSRFTIDSDTGWLKVFEPLDRETTDHYTLNITVYDLGLPQKSSSHMVNVNILDVNDNSPEFLQSEYSVDISEDTAMATDIIQLEAKDKDLGVNGMVRYSFLTKTDKFVIHEKMGIVTVMGPLDREANPSFVLKVAAFDAAIDEPKTVSTALLYINLKDVNDNAPTFIPQQYHIRVREDIPVGTLVLWLETHDPDLGLSGQVRYSLTDGEDGSFQVDKMTGAVYVSQTLDFETRQVYNLTAKAKDRGKPNPLSSSCFIHVEIVDVNENLYRPSFPFFVDWGAVSEDTSGGTSVLKVTAHDEDSGRDGEVRYSIRGGSGLGVFTIDEDSGIIRTQEILDHETSNHYWLTIYATDQGIVPLSSFVEVYIEVKDVNDNAPLTSEPVYYSSVSENSPKDVSVIQIQAFDLDTKSSDNLSYKITSGNPQGFFVINTQTGLVTTTARKLDREKQAEHLLEITVSDDGSPSKSTVVRVIVSVLDENDNSPQFLEKSFKIKLVERPEAVEWEPIYRVIAYDRDESPSSDISYTIEEGEEHGKFFIEPTTGFVFSKEAFSAGEYHILTIKASDNGKPSKSSICRLHIEWIPKPKLAKQPLAFEEIPLSFSVMENDPVAHMVGVISAQPLDSPVWFTIKGVTHVKEVFHILQMACDLNCTAGGNADGRFDVERASGTIIIAGALDAERQSNYNLTAEATDGTRSISTQVIIHVIDTNEHRPQFGQNQYEISIPEETQPGMKILEINATDKDEKNKLSYTLLSSTDLFSLKKFRLDPATGFLYIAEKLDHETMHRHILTLMVRDQGVPVKSNVVRVIINVEDSNDNAPWFTSSQYTARVFETAAIGSSVLQVTALDKDKGLNAEILYNIDSGNYGNSFNIDHSSGIVTVARELDREYKDQYELVIKASDKGEPPLSVVTTAKIMVTISDNTKPKFPFSSISAEVSESVPVGSFVTLASAFSQSTIYYQIEEGNVNSAFDINPNSGAVITRKKLDFETLSSYKLIVQGSDMAERSSSVTVNIHLKDENDNAPVFTQPEFTGLISESAIVRSVVLTSQNVPLVVRATDADQHSNGRLVYEIMEPFAHNYFSIDSGTGAIQTLSNLDYEQRKVFVFRVQVHDTGMPRLFARNTANVTIYVININDCTPKFTQDSYETTLLLPTYKGVKVTTVKATDEDSLPDTKLRFELVDGNIGNKFMLDPTSGDIFVQNATHLRSRYRLTIQVSDGSFTGTATVKVSVKENKGHNLKFTQEIFTAYVQENSAEKKTLAILSVVGNRVNEPLFYSILNPNSKFEMGRTSGVLFSTGIPFDREEQDLFEIFVEVTKEPKLNSTAHVLVRVHIEDVNDNVPVFVDQPYNVIVPIDKTVGSVFRKVTTVDKDMGRNAKVTYHLKGHDKYFQVSPSGEISLKRPLELKSVGKFVINITAQDGGESPLFSKAEVVISVVNKATPMFERPFYEIEIPENVQERTSILQVVANQSAGPCTVYSICGGNPFNQFYIDFNSGLIEVIRPLDYEAHPAYRLCIQATDSLTGANSDVFVDIILEDVNDNAPKFEAAVYNISISESAVIGTSVLQVVAMDSDTGSNAILFYQLYEKDGATSDHFRIDVESGVIWTAGLLDHETQSQHELIVKALDHGAFQLSAEVQVIIYVTDLNDNPPVFAHQLYNATISKISSPGQLVTCVKAYDADSHGTSQLEYAILSGNDNNIFAIDASSGQIVIANFSQQSLEHFYSLILSVTDGVFRRTAEANIYMMGENSHSPSFTQDEYVIELAENSPVGTLVGQVEATDKDPGIFGQLTLFIVNDIARDKFTINNDGRIYTVESFDRENPEEKTISISLMAQDGGGRLSFCTVIVTLSDVNDNSPKFRLSEYKVTVPGDAPSGTTVIKTSAVDEDDGSNADIIYTIDSDIGHFETNPLSGAIVTKESLIGLENGLYSFLVKAKDSGSPPRQSVIPVSIRIVPPETSIPKFAEPSLWLELSEDLAVGSEMDIFQTENKRPVIYSLVGGNTPESNKDDVFAIDSSTGKLTLTKRLDYETIKRYQLAVQVRDAEYRMEIVSVIDVSIHLKDVNDNSPQFESYPYQSYIVENLPKGTSIVQVKATDLDSWLNGQVTYTLHEIQERSDVLEMFAVNSESGWITTLNEIDREKTDRYRITVLATDQAQGLQMTGTTVVEVTVVDTNDNPPKFPEAVFKGTVREDESTPGSVVTILSYTDSDSEEVNRRFSCFITGGDPQGLFDVKHTDGVWVVTVSKTLDREERDFYLLNITATDGTFETKATVEITVLDANDNSPVCEKDVYTQTVPEDALVGRQILQVSATDADIQSNAEITYQLSGSGAESFTIDAKTGAVRTLVTLDREMTDVFNLTVRAMDGGNRFCQASVFITVDDVNDNAPKFTSDQHHISIFHNTQPGTYVARLEAFDADIGMNGKIRYTFEDSAGGLFTVEESSGIISLERSLDRQTKATHVLRIRATDHGSPHRLSSLSSVVVTVLDANDHPLAFEHREYVSTLPEDVTIGTKLLNVFAASRDREMSSQTTYSITSGNEQGAFRIDSQTGDIFVMEPLDYEVSPQHYLTVKATARGKESLSDIATVTVHLLDINDNSPVFSQKIYSAVVSEDTKLESTVLTVLANDFDGPLNNRIRYSIENNNQTCPFIMDAVSGELRLAHQLDREKVASYMLTVLASDSGNPPKSDSAAINMTVSDVNDNPPVFSQANYSLIIQENLPSGVAVLQLNVTDNDSPQNGPPFSFRILKGEETSPFIIDQQGVAKTTGPLRKGQHILQVQVSDNGRPPLKSVTSVSVLVVQTSVYPPSVHSLDVFIMILEDEYLGGTLGKVHATDQDEYDTLTFSLEPQSHSLFSVVGTDGRLLARGGLDVGHYQLNVSVSDSRFSALASVTVNVLRVTEQMLDSSVSVRFAGIAAEDFIQDHWKNLQKVVRSVAGVRRGALQLISLQSAETGDGLDVLLCFEKPGRGGSSLEAFSQKLSSSRAAIKEMTGLHVVRVLNSQCSSSECPGSMCRRVVLLNQTSMATYSTARVSYGTPRHHMTAKCLCTDRKCLKHKTTCENSPCPQGYECVSGFEENKHSCVCTGAAKVKCSGGSSMTFSESSYIKYRLRESMREVKLTLKLKTFSREGTVMLARGRGHSVLEIMGGRLQFQFDCGWGLATVSVHSVLVNDGQWHMAELEVKGNYARLVLDQLHSASGIAPGPLHCLNMGDQVVLGGPAQRFGSRLRRNLPVSDSLQGCMDSVLFNGQRLSLDSNGPLGVAIEDMVGVSPGCVSFPSPDCASNPCLNGGSCLMRQSGGYVCKCSTLFSGTHCEVKISPCDSNPCLYGGTCIQNNLDYYCKCRGHYSGQRCQIGLYCKENPCQNGGQCIDGLDGPICECEPGFKGERCMIDVDECVDRPCFNDGHCVNTYGSFNCSCLVEFSGRLCEMDTEVRNQVVSSFWNSWIGELVAMLAFLTAIFVLMLFFLIVWKGTCKPDKSDKVIDKYKDVDSYIQRSCVYNQARKVSCPDTPPQVPVRPISYTPSIPGECRNNRGSVPEFSSFMPDPLFGLRKTVAVCSVAPNLPHRKASHSHSENDSIQQMDWDEEYDEKVLDLTSCLAIEDDSISFSHENRGLRSMCSLQADVMDENSYYWDTSDCLQNIYSPGIQGFLQYEFVQMPSSTHTAPEILDMDYLTGGDDIENFLPVPALPLNTDMSAVPQYDQYTRPEVHHVIHPTATASQHPIHDYPQPIQTNFGVPQGPHIGPAEVSDSLESPL